MLLLLLFRRKLVLLLLALLVLLVLGPQLLMRAATWGDRYSSAPRTPVRDVGIVFGAGLRADTTPTPFLAARLDLAAQLYEDHRVKALLVTGDNRHSNHDEPTSMKTYLVAKGVPAKDVVLDDAGFSTYDSCYRAHAVFGVTSAVVISQGYHLPRAVYTCRKLGIDAVGLGDSQLGHHVSDTLQYTGREVLSSVKAEWQLLTKPKPHFLGPHESGLDAANS